MFGFGGPKFTRKPKMVCPHCGQSGKCRTREIKRKKGVSGGKATAAVLTLGWTLLVTGLAKKQMETEINCQNCDMTWHVE